MENFGLGDVINKIEEYFGRKITAAFLFLIMLSATVFLFNILFKLGIKPLSEFINRPDKNIIELAGSVIFIFTLGLISVIPGFFFVQWRLKGLKKRAEDVLQKSNLTLLRISRLMHEQGVISEEEYRECRASVLEADEGIRQPKE